MDLLKQQQFLANLTSQQKETINHYHDNNMMQLRKICDPIIYLKGVPPKDWDELYDVASDTLLESLMTYDDSKGSQFKTYLSGNIKRSFYDWTRDNRRGKRCNVERDKYGRIKRDKDGNPIVIPDISLNRENDEGIEFGESLDSGFNIENELAEEIGISLKDNVNNYIKTLSGKQKEMAKLFMQGCTPDEVRRKLEITEQQYKRYLSFMQKPERKRMLKQKLYMGVEEDNQMETQTRERSKETQYSILSLIKKMDGYTFRFDHSTQRESGRWNSKMKGNLISDILQNNPLPHLIFAEQIINGVAVTWNLDGKQKSTNAYEFYNNKFKINKDVRRWNIEYQTKQVDVNGNIILRNNLPVFESKTFDIRGKKFQDLPDELKERFFDYTFHCTQYLNCSDEDIEYHICRYNEGVRLNGSEKGMGEIGTKYAALIKEIASMSFFTERGGYKVSEFNNGTMNRVITESIMAINFLNDWKKKPEEMCSFMKDKVNEQTFENFTDIVERLDAVVTDNVCEMFDSKDSFLYFGLFARFINTGMDDRKFIEFMTEFGTNHLLHVKEVEGITYKSLCVDENGKSKGTKDKNIIISKMKLLEGLMCEFLNVETDERAEEVISAIDFVRENINPKTSEEDIADYEEDLDVLTLDVDNTSNLLDEHNRNSLIAIIAYSYKEDKQLDTWWKDYFNRKDTYERDQKKNYLHMKQDLEKYLEKEEIVA